MAIGNNLDFNYTNLFPQSPLLNIAALLVISCVVAVSGAGKRRSLIAPVPTPADQASSFRDSKTGQEILGRAVRREGGGGISWENKRYKCQVLSSLYRSARQKFPDSSNRILTPRLMELLQNCSSRDMRLDDLLDQQFIFPGTKWCGPGNISENNYDLGIFNETDACCQAHDNCQPVIKANDNKHNLLNPYATTRLHCKCDEELRRCFRRVNSVISNTVGYIFFSLLQTQCFDFNYPKTGCLLWRRGAVRLYCVKYKFDESQPKKWQWFDQEPYF